MPTEAKPLPLRTRPRVSVVIPCYNYGHFLPECVASVLGQPSVDVDVLIVDDCSPDGSVAVARSLAAADPRVKVLAHEVNRGHIATYNEGLAAVDGDYVLLLSADDLLAPGALARSAALLEAHPEVGMVYGFAPVFADVAPPARSQVRSWTIWSGPEWLEKVSRRVSNPIYTPEVVLRRGLMTELVGYDARLPHAADFLLWLRAASRGAVGRVNGVDQAFYRRHGSNMHIERYSGAVRDISERRAAFDILFAGDAEHIPTAPALADLARRALAREALILACQGYEHGRPEPESAESLAQLVELAAQIWPPATQSRLRRRYERHVARADRGRGPVVPPKLTVFADRALLHVQWRRWRRSGVSGAVRSV